jgi:hypothetical protein
MSFEFGEADSFSPGGRGSCGEGEAPAEPCGVRGDWEGSAGASPSRAASRRENKTSPAIANLS